MAPVLNASACSPVAPTAIHDEPLHILVVDDDADIRCLEARILTNAGHHVDMAADGFAAWRALLVGRYNLLVTDYIMPGVSGLALVRQLRVACVALPVVLVSGHLENLDIVRLKRDPWSCIQAFVRKPFTIPDLLSAVRSAAIAETTDAVSDHPRRTDLVSASPTGAP